MALKFDFPKCGTAATSSQNRSRPLCPLHPPVHRIPGPAQLEVCRLKVVKANEAEVRQALRRQGYTRTRVSQLCAECQQSPPRSWAQRQRQSAQDQPQCIHDASKELNSTNDAPSIIYPDSIIDCLSK